MQNFFWSAFSRIWTEYEGLRSKIGTIPRNLMHLALALVCIANIVIAIVILSKSLTILTKKINLTEPCLFSACKHNQNTDSQSSARKSASIRSP